MFASDPQQNAPDARTLTEQAMALMRRFKDLVESRVADDPSFGAALLREGIDALLGGDLETGEAILRYYIKAAPGVGAARPLAYPPRA